MSDFHFIVIFNDYYTLIVTFLTKQIQNRYRNRRVATPPFKNEAFFQKSTKLAMLALKAFVEDSKKEIK